MGINPMGGGYNMKRLVFAVSFFLAMMANAQIPRTGCPMIVVKCPLPGMPQPKCGCVSGRINKRPGVFVTVPVAVNGAIGLSTSFVPTPEAMGASVSVIGEEPNGAVLRTMFTVATLDAVPIGTVPAGTEFQATASSGGAPMMVTTVTMIAGVYEAADGSTVTIPGTFSGAPAVFVGSAPVPDAAVMASSDRITVNVAMVPALNIVGFVPITVGDGTSCDSVLLRVAPPLPR